jgi:hypothetical protein
MKNAKALAEYMVGKVIDELDFEPSPSAIDRAVAHVEGILTKSGNLFRVVSDPERMDRIRGKVIDILGRDGMRRNPMRDTIKVGDKVMGIMGIEGGYAGTVTAIKRDGRHTVVFFVDDDGVKYETLDFNVTKNVPAKGVFPRKNPVTRRKGESIRDFTSRCMSEEKASFPEPKQRIAVCLSKSRKRNPVYDTGSDE